MDLDNKVAIIVIRENGYKIANRISHKLNSVIFIKKETEIDGAQYFSDLKTVFKKVFFEYRYIVAIMAQGIVSRMISGLPKNKHTDPAVVVVDEKGRYAISMLSGHEGKANKLAFSISSIIGCEPIITTATEANKTYVAGIGCRKNITKKQVEEALNKATSLANINIDDLRLVATCWHKENEEGLIDAIEKLNLNMRFLPKFLYENELYNFKETAASKYLNIKNVAEASALIASKNPKFILRKTVFDGVTVSIVKEELP